jgi:hypothetical protein
LAHELAVDVQLGAAGGALAVEQVRLIGGFELVPELMPPSGLGDWGGHGVGGTADVVVGVVQAAFLDVEGPAADPDPWQIRTPSAPSAGISTSAVMLWVRLSILGPAK